MRSLPVLAALPLILALTGAAKVPESVWRNPSNSVHIRFEACEDRLCGRVVWASDKAIADTRKGGGGELVGTQIFRGMREVKPDLWKGKVYVPDIRKTFGGTITRIDDTTLMGKGCLIAGIGCKSQKWTKVGG